MSTGTVRNILMKAGDRASPVVEAIRDALRKAALIGSDETGASLAGHNHWLHTVSTPLLSYYHFHPKRGFEAMEEIGILPDFTGGVIHDFFQSYYQYEACRHYLCNAHHLRDLTYVHEEMDQAWAEEMIELLLDAKDLRERHDSGGRRIGPVTRKRILTQYRKILDEGYAINPEPQKTAGKRGRPKRGKALNLLDRFRQRENEVLGFFLEDGIPFDNNQAERDLRMIKAKLKISGCFRSPKAACAFAKVRSVITTARKQGDSILDTLKFLFQNPPHLVQQLVEWQFST
jgi:transposase